MAFDKTKLYKRSANFTGMKDWGYDAGADTIATVNTDGYFNKAYKDLEVGDSIRVKSSSGTVYTDVLVLSNNYDPVAATGSVDVSDGVTITLTDGD